MITGADQMDGKLLTGPMPQTRDILLGPPG